MCQGVVHELTLRDIEIAGIGILMTLVGIELVERFLLVLLGPATIRSVHATIDPCGIGANSCQATTLFEGTLTNIHATSVTHTIGLTTAILRTETILHELLIRLSRDLNRGAIRVGAIVAVNTWCGLVVVVVLHIIAIALETGGILRHRLCRDKPLRTIEPETIVSKTSLRPVSSALRFLMLVAGYDTRHTLSTTRHSGKSRRKMSGRLGLVVSEFANNGGPTTGDIHRRTGTSREGREPVLA